MSVAVAQLSVPRKSIFGYRLLNEASWINLAKALVAEYVMTAAFLFLATGMVVSGCNSTGNLSDSVAGSSATTKAAPGSCFLGSTTLLNIAFGFGFSIFIAVYVAASFSGGHINPAVTLAFMLTQRVSIVRGFLYIIFQCLGACTGSAFVYAINGNGFRAAIGAANRLNTGIDVVNAWAVETILTFILVLVVFSATDSAQAVKAVHLPALAPFAIGTYVFLAHLVALPIDGCSINPARSFGPSAVAHNWHNQWIFWVGPFGGAIIAALGYDLLLRHYPLPTDRLGEAKVGATVASLGDEVHKQKRDAAAQNANGGVHPHEAIV